MSDKNERVTLNYTIGEHPEIKGRIVFAFDDTGLKLNEENKQFLDVIAKVIASQLYAKANGIPIENVKF